MVIKKTIKVRQRRIKVIQTTNFVTAILWLSAIPISGTQVKPSWFPGIVMVWCRDAAVAQADDVG
jgi:hypothetical protein